ncbi:hypothetical protein PFICI_12879 [Pestalotiopsis fici W106-1]|uniref:LysM domain-containing protein n=1 Tax=Pestalotiopsis fici (strain W106-1 / CGMCC3.15140) TaxID=1229662 RepID=W3WPW4_PESFW|nr:uncharacterized protein PFICI_12879 [Pestalotiopsis fici W106-1]ETS75935.1 hypothetical protein PFICI_12879 [Pestalotiopsis fici W106-1]
MSPYLSLGRIYVLILLLLPKPLNQPPEIFRHGTLASFDRKTLYDRIAPLAAPNDTLFDNFFAALVTSRYAIPISIISNPTQSKVVIDAIRLQHGIIEAQFLSANYRVDMNSPKATENATNVLIPTLLNGSTTGNSTNYPATVTYPFGRQRIVQDHTATTILEVLLLTILILSALSWWFGPREAALPRSPTSVASVLALLAGDLYVAPSKTYANGTRTDCATHISGSDYQSDISNTTFSSNWDLAITVFSITYAELNLWNPFLAYDSIEHCTFREDLEYCVEWSPIGETTTEASLITTIPTAVSIRVPNDCTQWAFIHGDSTCEDILQVWQITLDYFVSLNEGLGDDCSGLQNLTYYCVNSTSNPAPAISDELGTATATATSTSNSIVTPPGPTQTGIPSNCNNYYVAQSGDTCSSVEELYNITNEQFHAWNPAVSSDCTSGFWSDEAYCVRVAGSEGGNTTITVSSTSASTTFSRTTTTIVPPPGPTQDGIPDNCNVYYVAQSGDDCSTIEAEFGITDAQFHEWNPAVSSDCVSGFWADEAYCVGIAV